MIHARLFTPQDLPVCTAIYMETYALEPWNETWDSPDVVRRFLQRHLANNYSLAYVLADGDTVIGASFGFTKPWIAGMEYYIDEFYLQPDRQGQGLGTRFMQHIKTDAKARGLSAIILLTERDYPARRFYQRNGFGMSQGMVVMSTGL